MAEEHGDLLAQITEHGLGEWANSLIAQATPSIHFTAKRDKENPPALGASKIGGEPDLPKDMPWPLWNDRPLAFLAQICLSSLPKQAKASDLPPHGMLYFFFDWEEQPWGFEPDHAGGTRVCYSPTEDNLDKRTMPEELEDEGWYLECSLDAFASWSFPTDVPEFLKSKAKPGWFRRLLANTFSLEVALKPSPQENAYHELVDSSWHGGIAWERTKLLGLPDLIQGPMEFACQLASHGISVGDSSWQDDPQLDSLRDGINDWKLLFQLGSHTAADMMWGDAGKLYFWIRQQDLASRNFDATWTILQCS